MEKLEVLTGMVIKLPESFNLELAQWVLDLKKIGIKTTKADEVVKLARIGYLKETNK